MAIHKWSDIKNNMSPERTAKADEMVRKELVKMNSFFIYRRLSPTCWQLHIGPLWFVRNDDKLTVLWGALFTIFSGIFWSKSNPLLEIKEPRKWTELEELSPGSYEDSAFAEWTWKKGVGLVKKDECLIPETPLPLTKNELEHGKRVAETLKSECCCSATYCSTGKEFEELPKGGGFIKYGEPKVEEKKDIPDPSDKFPEYQKQYWYPGTNIWESWRKHFNLTKEEAEARWGKKLL